MDIIIIQIILGVLLFFLINWIGKHSYSIGYIEISIFVKTEEAPAFNFLIRVMTPIVYIIIISSILYYFKLDKYVNNIYWVNIFYIIFRLSFNLITNRGLLLNWYRQFLYWISIIIVSFFTYEKLIKIKANILPDFTTISNELWIIILVFIFHLANNIRFSSETTQKRKDNYIKTRYLHFEKLYGKIIKNITQNEILECIVYSVIIYEDFNRPKITRYIENLNFRRTKKNHTLGVMQVESDKLINDKESVILGTEKIVKAYLDYLNNPIETYFEDGDYYIKEAIINNYNSGNSYSIEVIELSDTIKDLFYKDTIDTLALAKKESNIGISETTK